MYTLMRTSSMLPLESSDVMTSRFGLKKSEFDVTNANGVNLADFYNVKNSVHEFRLKVSEDILPKAKVRPGILRSVSAYDVTESDTDTGEDERPSRRVQFCSAENLVRIREIPPRENRSSDEETSDEDEDDDDDDEEEDDTSDDSSSSEEEKEDRAKDIAEAKRLADMFNSMSQRRQTPLRPSSVGRGFRGRAFVSQGVITKNSEPPKQSPRNTNPKPKITRKRKPKPTTVNETPPMEKTANHREVSKEGTPSLRRRPQSPQLIRSQEMKSDPKPETRRLTRRHSTENFRRRASEPTVMVSTTPVDKFRPQLVPTKNGATNATIQAATEALIKELPWLTLPRVHYSPYRHISTSPSPSPQREVAISHRLAVSRPSSSRLEASSNSRKFAWNTPATAHLFKEEPCISQMWDLSPRAHGSKSPT